ncbi:MAG: sulfurtransferase TusA family protein [Pseudomonadota bacterium]
MSEHTLDARNLLCPMPVIRTQNKIRTLADGDTLKVICTDPGTLSDIPAWCRINGHSVLDTQKGERELVITIRISKGAA